MRHWFEHNGERPFACCCPLACRVGMGCELGLYLAGSAERLVVQNFEIFPDSPRRIIRIDTLRVPLFLGRRVLLVGIGFNQAGIHGEALAADQPLFHATLDSHLEHVAQQVTLAKPTMPVLGKRRVIRNRVGQVEPTKPATGQVQMHFLAQSPF